MNRTKSPNRSAFTLVELLVVIAIIGVLIGMTLPAVQRIRDAASRTKCGNNIRQLGLATLNYESARMQFPVGAEHFTAHSWISRSLPYLEQGNIYSQLDFELAWNDPANSKPIRQTIAVLSCPSSWKDYEGATDYCGISGSWRPQHAGNGSRNGILFTAPRNKGVRFADVTDGTSQTICIAEGVAVDQRNEGYWACGLHCFSHDDGPVNNLQGGLKEIASLHAGGAQVAFVDGSVHFLNTSVDADVVGALCTRNGNEITGSH